MGRTYSINGHRASRRDFGILQEFLERNGAPRSISGDRRLSLKEIMNYLPPPGGSGPAPATCARRFGVVDDILRSKGLHVDVTEPCDIRASTGMTHEPNIYLSKTKGSNKLKKTGGIQEFLADERHYKFQDNRFYVEAGADNWDEIDLTPFYDGVGEGSCRPERIVHDPSSDRFFVIGTTRGERYLLWYDPKTDSTSYVLTIDGHHRIPPDLEISDDGTELHIIFKSYRRRVSLERFDYYAKTDGWEFFKAPSDQLYDIKSSPTSPDTVFMYGDVGLYVSKDAGKTWQKTSIHDQVSDVKFDPRDPNVIHVIEGFDPSRHLVSRDGGLTWTVRHILEGRSVASMVFDKNDPGVLYFGLSDGDHENPSGIVRSENGEYEFHAFGHGQTGLIAWDIGQDNSGRLHLVPEIYDHPGAKRGKYQPPYLTSSDEGKTWEIYRNGRGVYWHVESFSLNEETGELYAQTEGGRLYKTADGGKSWSIVDEAYHFGDAILFDENRDLMMRCRSFSFADPTIGGIYSRPLEGGAWDLEDSLGFRSIVSITEGSDYIYAFEKNSKSVGIWRRKK